MLRESLIILLILFIVAGFIYKIPIQVAQRYDPPSVFNYGNGGYSSLYLLLARSGYRVYVVYDTNQLETYPPEKSALILASPDKSLSQDESREILKWVSEGGVALVLDEIGTVNSLARELGVEINVFAGDVAVGECYINGTRYPIILNKFSDIKILSINTSNVEGSCYAEGYVVGVLERVGRGQVLVLGDSSLFINAMLRSKEIGANIVFLSNLIRDRDIVFYEGDRDYIVINTDAILQVLSGLAGFFSQVIRYTFSRDLFMSLLLTTLFISIISLIYLREYLGEEPYARREKRINRIDKKSVIGRYKNWLEKKER